MKTDPKVLLRQAIQKCLPQLQSRLRDCLSDQLVWERLSENNWTGQHKLLPDINYVFMLSQTEIETAAEPFAESFFKHYPEHKEMTFSHQFISPNNFGEDRAFVLHRSLSYLWKSYGKFDLSENVIDELVNKFEMFIDESTVRVFFSSILLNFHSPDCDSIDLPEGLRIRRLSDSEISKLNDGSRQSGMFRNRRYASSMYEFCIEGEIKKQKIFGCINENESLSEINPEKEKLDKAMVYLRTFKGGRVGYDSIQYNPDIFTPVSSPSLSYGDLYVPIGWYEIKNEEVIPLEKHANRIFNILKKSDGTKSKGKKSADKNSAIRMACSRLADAENRTNHHDKIVDAVIGMEALLFASSDDHSELKFRFSLHYAMIFPPEIRHDKFQFAGDIYKLRSTIAHGSLVGNDFTICGQKRSIAIAADEATAALRKIILDFSSMDGAPYTEDIFWRNKFLGIPEENSMGKTPSL
jgi:hypothetical protein